MSCKADYIHCVNQIISDRSIVACVSPYHRYEIIDYDQRNNLIIAVARSAGGAHKSIDGSTK